jgi:hypothetical protein
MVERSMFWDEQYYGGHGGTAVDGAKTKWYFGEGSQGFFDTYILLANSNSTAAAVTVRFLREVGAPVVKTYLVGATSRMNVYAGAIPELLNTSFSIVVDSNIPITAERAMYFGATPFWNGGHESAGVGEPSTSWSHAEGATGSYFDTFILVGNPNAVSANLTVTFLLESGLAIPKNYVVPADSRLTIDVEAQDPRLASAAVSTTVASNVPVISERAMYWPGAFVTWAEAHNSFGVTETATKWGLAEGRAGGPEAFDTYILLANATNTAASVRVTFLRPNGTTLVRTYTVPATSRFNIPVNGLVRELVPPRGAAATTFGVVVEVTNGVPISVERAMYWNALGAVWAGGTNATATRLP